jgi:iron-sulfur cluster repair protein YtfE (RIC family)
MTLTIFKRLVATLSNKPYSDPRFCNVDVDHDCVHDYRTETFKTTVYTTLKVEHVSTRDDIPACIQRTMELISREVYGELIDDALMLLSVLHTECYRSKDDKSASMLRAMIDKMRGEN